MSLRYKRVESQQGDSLVEVLLSLAVLSLVILISWTIVNRAANINLAARQRVVMVNALREQAEILQARYEDEGTRAALISESGGGDNPPIALSDSYSNNIIAGIPANPCAQKDATGAPIPSSPFYYNDEAAQTSGIKEDVGGYQNAYLWIQKRVAQETSPHQEKGKYVDFYIRACWQSSSGGVQTEDSSNFVVRLNR